MNIMYIKLESTEILEITFFCLIISSNSYHKKMLLELLTIPLNVFGLMDLPELGKHLTKQLNLKKDISLQ